MIKLTLLTATTLSIFATVNDFHHSLPTPVKFKEQVKEDSRLKATNEALTFLGRDLKYSEPIWIAAKANNIDPVLFTFLIESESEFDIKALSKKGYKGLGQTPVAVRKQGYEVVDLTLASCVLKEKLNSSYANGNMLRAIQLYKGGANREALKYATQVMNKYNSYKHMKG